MMELINLTVSGSPDLLKCILFDQIISTFCGNFVMKKRFNCLNICILQSSTGSSRTFSVWDHIEKQIDVFSFFNPYRTCRMFQDACFLLINDIEQTSCFHPKNSISIFLSINETNGIRDSKKQLRSCAHFRSRWPQDSLKIMASMTHQIWRILGPLSPLCLTPHQLQVSICKIL